MTFGGSKVAVAAIVLIAILPACADQTRAPADDAVTTKRGALSVSSELILDPPFAGASRYGRAPAIAFDGTNFLAVYGDGQGAGTATVSATRVTPAGEVLDRPGNIVAFQSTPTPVVAFGSGTYLVVWQDGYNYDVYYRRVGTDGKPVGTASRPWSNDFDNEYDPTVAFDGTNFVIAFRTSRGQIVASRVGPNGSLLDSTPKVIVNAPASSSDYPIGPRLAFDGTNYQLVWQSNSSVGKLLGVRFSTALAVVANSMNTVSPPTAYSAATPALAFGNGQHLVAWAERTTVSDPNPSIRAGRLDPSGTLIGDITVAPATVGNATPAVAFDGTGWLVMWAQTTGGTYPNVVASVRAARVGAGGTLLDTTPILVTEYRKSTRLNSSHG
jgi:hypothetical protein